MKCCRFKETRIVKTIRDHEKAVRLNIFAGIQTNLLNCRIDPLYLMAVYIELINLS